MFKLSNLILNPKRAERHPFEMFLFGFVYSSLSIIISLWVFQGYASLVTVFLTVISCLYVVQRAIIIEEKNEKEYSSEEHLLKQHTRVLTMLLSLFVGFTLSFALWTIILPQETSTLLFSTQASSAQWIQSITGNAVSQNSLQIILSNNIKVLLFSLLFAVFYGAGAIFILAWNASVMGFVIGTLARYTLGLSSLPLLFTRYFLHGIPEILAYFLASLAGGLMFVSLLKGDLLKEHAKKITVDIIILVLLSIVVLIIAALLEVYVSPFI